jgi:hypothetical protein
MRRDGGAVDGAKSTLRAGGCCPEYSDLRFARPKDVFVIATVGEAREIAAACAQHIRSWDTANQAATRAGTRIIRSQNGSIPPGDAPVSYCNRLRHADCCSLGGSRCPIAALTNLGSVERAAHVGPCVGYFPPPPHDRSGVAAEQGLMIAFRFARIAPCSASPAPGLRRRSPIWQPRR